MSDDHSHPILNNPKDPLLSVASANQRELLERLGKAMSGFPMDLVIGASINLFVNALRQTYASGPQANARYREIVGQFEGILMQHYDSVTGKRKNTFAHTQIVQAAHVHADDVIRS